MIFVGFYKTELSLATKPHSPNVKNTRDICARYYCSTFNVAVGLLSASCMSKMVPFHAHSQKFQSDDINICFTDDILLNTRKENMSSSCS